jgi:hypothetical protein
VNAYWISWYHDPRDGAFELHTPWWVSGFTMDNPQRETIVAAVQATSEDEAWDVVREAYDASPSRLQERFCEELDDGPNQPNKTAPWSTPENGRFPQADWMRWEAPV